MLSLRYCFSLKDFLFSLPRVPSLEGYTPANQHVTLLTCWQLTLLQIPNPRRIQGPCHKWGGFFEFQNGLKAGSGRKTGQVTIPHFGCPSELEWAHFWVRWGWEDTMLKARRPQERTPTCQLIFSSSCSWDMPLSELLEAADSTDTTILPFTLKTSHWWKGNPPPGMHKTPKWAPAPCL